MSGFGAGRSASAQIARNSAFCQPPVTILAAAFKVMLIGTISVLLMLALVYISSLKLRAGITVALMSHDAISGLSFLVSIIVISVIYHDILGCSYHS